MRIGNSKVNNATMLAIGCMIGAGSAILLAPQSGKQTRRDIVHFGKVVRNRCERASLDFGHRSNRMFDKLSEKWQDDVHRYHRLADDAKHIIKEGREYFQKRSA
jgi:gas vesicle protein